VDDEGKIDNAPEDHVPLNEHTLTVVPDPDTAEPKEEDDVVAPVALATSDGVTSPASAVSALNVAEDAVNTGRTRHLAI